MIRRPPGLFHPPPVLERLRDQRLGGDRGDGLVPVLHLDRVQRDLYDVPVRAVRRHLDPISHVDHVVARELHARDEPHDRVAKHEQEHRAHGAEARE